MRPDDQQSVRILVVEDDVAMVSAAVDRLAQHGIIAESCESPNEALEVLREGTFDGAIVDLRLSEELEGLALIEMIRIRVGSGFPIVVLSAETDFDTKIDALRRGANAYFEKPADWNKVVSKLASLVEARPPSILCVEDDPFQAEIIAAVLGEDGFEVRVLPDPAGFETQMTSFVPDLVIVDIMMPKINGLELVKFMRQDDRFAMIPLIILTAYRDLASDTSAAALGADWLLYKPYAPSDLIGAARSALGRFRRLKDMLDRDPLTGLLTRSAFSARASAAMALHARRKDRMATIGMIDLDGFKKINDTYGHAFGDRVLAGLGVTLSQGIRETDVVARYGGEEFAILLSEASGEGARSLVERLLSGFAAVNFGTEEAPVNVTFSAGLSELTDQPTLERWLAEADRALYEAKDRGRNRVMVKSEVPDDSLQTPAGIDARTLQNLERLGESTGRDVVGDVVSLFLDSVEERIRTLQRTLDEADTRGCVRAAHAFRGAAGNIGARDLMRAALRVEVAAHDGDVDGARRLIDPLRAELTRISSWLESRRKAEQTE